MVVLIELVDSDNVTLATMYSFEVEYENPSTSNEMSYE
jgi:hypothetical protein